MSAMPERELWWLNPEEDGTAVVVGFDPGASYPLAVKLVPESALLAAEARVRELEQIHRDEMDLHDEMEAKLAADLDALVPLARLGREILDDTIQNYGSSGLLDFAAKLGVLGRDLQEGGMCYPETKATTAARARVLALYAERQGEVYEVDRGPPDSDGCPTQPFVLLRGDLVDATRVRVTKVEEAK